MKLTVLFLVVFVSTVELRRHSSDLYGLDDLLNRKRERPQLYSLDDDEQDARSIYEMDTPETQANAGDYPADEPDRVRPSKPHRVASFLDDDETTTKRTTGAKPSACFTDYETKAEQLVKVKDLKNNERLIRVALIDKSSLSSSLKDACMQHCCSENTCDLAMLSEQHTHVSHSPVFLARSCPSLSLSLIQEGYKCYLFACNGSCPLAAHQDYSIMIPKIDASYYKDVVVTTPASSTLSKHAASRDDSSTSYSFSRSSLISLVVLGIVSVIISIAVTACFCRQRKQRGRRSKNYAVDADYLINGLYL